MLIFTAIAFHRWDVPMPYMVYLFFLGVPLLTLVKIANTDISKYDTISWKPRKIEK